MSIEARKLCEMKEAAGESSLSMTFVPKVTSCNSSHPTPCKWIKDKTAFGKILGDNRCDTLWWNLCVVGVSIISICVLSGRNLFV